MAAKATLMAKQTIMMCAYELKQTAIREVLVRVLNSSITVEVLDPSECAASAYVISLNPHQFKRLKIGFHHDYEDYQEACFDSMLAELPKNNDVVHLTLDALSLSDGTVSAMVKLLQYFPNLQRLELFDLDISHGVLLTVDKELEGLKKVLKHLSHLNLRRNSNKHPTNFHLVVFQHFITREKITCRLFCTASTEKLGGAWEQG